MKFDFISDINKEHYYNLHYADIDRFIVKVLWYHFFLFSLAALAIYYFRPAEFYPSPLAWKVTSLGETFVTIGLGLLATFLASALYSRVRNHYHYRLLAANCLFVYSYLIVFITGGSIEAHFHFFAMFALLAIYADWRLGWVGLAAVALHHGILNYVEPSWVYFYGRNDLSVLAHALPVAVAALFLTWVTQGMRQSVEHLAASNREYELKLRSKIPNLSRS